MLPHFPARCLRVPNPVREFGLQLTADNELVVLEPQLRYAMSARRAEQKRSGEDCLADAVLGDQR